MFKLEFETDGIVKRATGNDKKLSMCLKIISYNKPSLGLTSNTTHLNLSSESPKQIKVSIMPTDNLYLFICKYY